MSTVSLDLTADMIDVRDIIARVEELETDRERFGEEPSSWATEYPEDADELKLLESLLADLKGAGGDEQWRGDWYPVMLIRDDHFEDYAREYADDVAGMNDRDMNWPFCHIDWTAAAESLQMDYTSTDIEGTDYWFR